MKVYFSILLATTIALSASAHPGKTDRQGGHKCYKDCAEWDLYYAEYHLHDKDGKAVKVARKKPVRARPEAAVVEEKSVIEEKPADSPAATTPAQTFTAAAVVAVENDTPSLLWILLVLFLLLLLVVRRNRRKASDAEQAVISS